MVSKQAKLEEKLKACGFEITNRSKKLQFFMEGQFESQNFQLLASEKTNDFSLCLWASQPEKRNQTATYRSHGQELRTEELREIECSAESLADSVGKKLQLTNEFQTKDPIFNENVYIVSDCSPRTLTLVFEQERVRQSLLRFVQQGFRITLYGGKSLIRVQGTSTSTIWDFIEHLSENLREMIALSEALPINGETPSSKKSKEEQILRWGPLFAFVSLSLTFMWMVFTPYPTTTSWFPLPWLWYSLPWLFVFPILMAIRHRKRANNLRLAAQTLWFGLSFSALISWGLCFTNGFLDTSVIQTTPTILVDAREYKKRCTYSLQSWSSTQRSSIYKYSKNSACPSGLVRQSTILVQTKAGYWQQPWLVGLQTLPSHSLPAKQR
jgi:hypothetical protein